MAQQGWVAGSLYPFWTRGCSYMGARERGRVAASAPHLLCDLCRSFQLSLAFVISWFFLKWLHFSLHLHLVSLCLESWMWISLDRFSECDPQEGFLVHIPGWFGLQSIILAIFDSCRIPSLFTHLCLFAA